MPAPKKLVNPFEKMAQASTTSSLTPRASPSGPKKLTWSERQALAKKQQEEEEEQSRAASLKATPSSSTGSKWTRPSVSSASAAIGAAAGVGIVAGVSLASASADDAPDHVEEEASIPPPAPPLPPAASRPQFTPAIPVPEPDPEQEAEESGPPPPVSHCLFCILVNIQ